MTQPRMLAFIAVAALTTALWSPGRAVAADAGSQRGSQHDVLRERATGTGTGEFGTLEFEKGKTESRGLVLVPDAHLLVDPGLVPPVDTRA